MSRHEGYPRAYGHVPRLSTEAMEAWLGHACGCECGPCTEALGKGLLKMRGDSADERVEQLARFMSMHDHTCQCMNCKKARMIAVHQNRKMTQTSDTWAVQLSRANVEAQKLKDQKAAEPAAWEDLTPVQRAGLHAHHRAHAWGRRTVLGCGPAFGSFLASCWTPDDVAGRLFATAWVLAFIPFVLGIITIVHAAIYTNVNTSDHRAAIRRAIYGDRAG